MRTRTTLVILDKLFLDREIDRVRRFLYEKVKVGCPRMAKDNECSFKESCWYSHDPKLVKKAAEDYLNKNVEMIKESNPGQAYNIL